MTQVNEWTNAEHALRYLAQADRIPHRSAGEAVLLDLVPHDVSRILDLGTGDGRLLALLLIDRPDAHGVALDFSPTMLAAARARFAGDSRVTIVEHNLDEPLPDLGGFDAIVSSFAIHHCDDDRKRQLYAEVFSRLERAGVFWNLEHVAPPSAGAHEQYLRALGMTAADEDPSNKLAPVDTQLAWLREVGFVDVDCYWNWLELALMGGVRPV